MITLRNGLSKSIQKLIDEQCKELIENYVEENLTTLECLLETLVSKFEKLVKLNEEISELINDDLELEEHFDSADKYETLFKQEIKKLRDFIKKCSPEESIFVSENKTYEFQERSSGTKSVIKLPKMEIRKFNGDPLNWKSFNDSFTAAVDKNPHLTDVEKMNYLVSYLKGEAENAVKGLPLCNENYVIAKQMLEERFGDPQVLISSHMNKLLSLSCISNMNNLKDMRKLCDQVESQVRCLNALGHDPKSYGLMLIPVFMTKIPEEFKLIISRKLEKDVWDIQMILDAFKLELEAREKVQVSLPNPFSGHSDIPLSTLHISNSKSVKTLKCVFCSNDHKPQHCTVVSKVPARLAIAREKRLCFACLQPGHSSSDCPKKWKCFVCKKRHHVAICYSKEKEYFKVTFAPFSAEKIFLMPMSSKVEK